MIIGLTGKKQSGKDTIADYLVNRFKFTKIAFADPIKDICKTMFSFTYDQLYGNAKETLDETYKILPRDAMKFVGMEFRENMHKLIPDVRDNIWISIMLNKIQKLRQKDPFCNIVITDIRFPNEYQMLVSHFVDPIVLWKVTRDNTMANDDHHFSESFVDDFVVNKTFENDDTIDNLYQNVCSVMMDLLEDCECQKDMRNDGHIKNYQCDSQNYSQFL